MGSFFYFATEVTESMEKWGARTNSATPPPRRLLEITEKTQEIQQPQLGSFDKDMNIPNYTHRLFLAMILVCGSTHSLWQTQFSSSQFQVPVISISRIHTKILSDSHQKHVFLQKNRRSIKFPKSPRFCNISVIPGDHAPFLETHGHSVRLGRSVFCRSDDFRVSVDTGHPSRLRSSSLSSPRWYHLQSFFRRSLYLASLRGETTSVLRSWL